MTVKYRKTTFSIEGSEMVSVGWTAGERWNGWACPRFTKEEADKIMNDYNFLGIPSPATYDEATDTYHFPHTCGDSDLDEYAQGMFINTFEGKIKVYPIGAGAWVWDDESTCNKSVNSGVLLKEENEEEEAC